MVKYGKPIIFNTDQGCQYTCEEITKMLKGQNIKISMASKERCFDNIHIERLWRTVKYENIYLKDYENFKECVKYVNKYFNFYNKERIHESLKYLCPDEVYFGNLERYDVTFKIVG